MIIPVRCMGCGKEISSLWRYYQQQMKLAKGDQAEQRVYFDGTSIPETAEKKILDSMGVLRPCCRKHFLTQVDLIDRI